MTTCSNEVCTAEAVMAVASARTRTRGIRTTLYYDLDDPVPAKADRLCRQHGRDLVDGLIATLVSA